MKTAAKLSFLLASSSLPLLTLAAPARTSSVVFKDSHGSGWEIHTYKNRAFIPAAPTPAPEPVHAPVFVAVPVARDLEVKREADADAKPDIETATGGLPSFFAPIPDTKINGPLIKNREADPEPEPEAKPVDVTAGASALPGFFAPIPSFKVSGSLKGREANPEAAPEPEPEPIDTETSESALPGFFAPIPNFKTSGSLKDREADAEPEAEFAKPVDLIAPMANHKFGSVRTLKEREAEPVTEA